MGEHAPMITFADLVPAPTVWLSLRVPVTLPLGGWTWGQLPTHPDPLAWEYAYSADECHALVRTYGRTMGAILAGTHTERFRIAAWGPVTGVCLGLKEWTWDAGHGRYSRAGEYLCGWRTGLRAYFLQTGELFSTKRFRAHPPGLPAQPCTRRLGWPHAS